VKANFYKGKSPFIAVYYYDYYDWLKNDLVPKEKKQQHILESFRKVLIFESLNESKNC